MIDHSIQRRALLAGGIAAGAALFVPARLASAIQPLSESLPAAPAPSSMLATGPEKRLALRCIHTGHSCDAVFQRGRRFDAAGLAELNQGLRDWRTGEQIEIDRNLLSLLAELRDSLGLTARTPFQLISGYRAPGTNAALHGRSGGVATKSQHMLGKAVDIALPGTPTDRIRQAAMALRGGGVGHYPEDGFVHIDTGRVRFW